MTTLAPPHITTDFQRQLRRPIRVLEPDPLATLDLIPWSRVWHPYGPAREMPAAIRGLDSRAHAECGDRLALWVEHQDTFSHAGALAIPFICELLLAGRVRSPRAVAALLESFQRTADWLILASEESPDVAYDDLLLPERLAPELPDPPGAMHRGAPPYVLPPWYDALALACVVADELAVRLPEL